MVKASGEVCCVSSVDLKRQFVGSAKELPRNMNNESLISLIREGVDIFKRYVEKSFHYLPVIHVSF